jgi:hypothetical protein
MEHVVFFPAHDGSPAFRRLASLEDAVRFVEHLRNSEGVDRVSVHALTEVPMAFKAYYKVEMPAGAEAAPAVEPVVEAPQVAVAAETVVPVLVPEQEQPVAEEAAPAPSSLGFFAR